MERFESHGFTYLIEARAFSRGPSFNPRHNRGARKGTRYVISLPGTLLYEVGASMEEARAICEEHAAGLAADYDVERIMRLHLAAL